MEYIADLHIHSKYAMACSEQLTLENMDSTAKAKGIGIMGTGDFTHPLWLKELKSKLVERDGMHYLKDSQGGTAFVLSSEVCTIFEDRSGKSRKIHHCIFAPDLEAAEHIGHELSKFGDLSSDGRPALNLSPAALVEIASGVSRDTFIFPAHAWTPWFGVLGAFSGFDSISDAYEDQAGKIRALETGLSSDPGMNWRVSSLDKYSLISGSDAHSLPKIGREAVVMDMEKPAYGELVRKIVEKEMKLTVEFYPEEGKYHFDGHRNCNVSLSPEESAKYGDRCPKCARRLTIGVLHRVNALADREEGYRPKGAVPYIHAIPLQEIIAQVMGKNVLSPYVKRTYQELLSNFGTEFDVLLKCDVDTLGSMDRKLGSAIDAMRDERVNLVPGYDGVFGIVDVLNQAKAKKAHGKQSRINEF